MNEGPEGRKAGFEREIAAGIELQREDDQHPERGPIFRMTQSVLAAASYDKGPLGQEFKSFVESFEENVRECGRYRLYNVIKGIPPGENATMFDAEGQWSIETKMRELAEKYHIDTEQV